MNQLDAMMLYALHHYMTLTQQWWFISSLCSRKNDAINVVYNCRHMCAAAATSSLQLRHSSKTSTRSNFWHQLKAANERPVINIIRHRNGTTHKDWVSYKQLETNIEGTFASLYAPNLTQSHADSLGYYQFHVDAVADTRSISVCV